MYSAVYSLLTGLIQNLAQNTAHQEGLSIVQTELMMVCEEGEKRMDWNYLVIG